MSRSEPRTDDRPGAAPPVGLPTGLPTGLPAGLPAGLLSGLVDDAAVFPPGDAPLDRAVVEHRVHRTAPYADAVGPLLVRAADAATAAALLSPGERLGVALVVRPGADPDDLPHAVQALRDEDRAEVRAVELPLATPERLAPLVALGAPLWLEVARTALTRDLDAVAAAAAAPGAPMVGAKLRTGGLHRADFPDEQELATFLAGAVQRGLAVKLTAGLHHAVRHRDPVHGFEQHGVLNVLAATALQTALLTTAQGPARGSATAVAQGAALLAERDPQVLLAVLARLDPAGVQRVRTTFASFGCCGVTEPLTEITRLAATAPAVAATGPHDQASGTAGPDAPQEDLP